MKPYNQLKNLGEGLAKGLVKNKIEKKLSKTTELERKIKKIKLNKILK